MLFPLLALLPGLLLAQASAAPRDEAFGMNRCLGIYAQMLTEDPIRGPAFRKYRKPEYVRNNGDAAEELSQARGDFLDALAPDPISRDLGVQSVLADLRDRSRL